MTVEAPFLFGAEPYMFSPVRFCANCLTGTDDRRCWCCGRFTSRLAPPGWYAATHQTNFTAELAALKGTN